MTYWLIPASDAPDVQVAILTAIAASAYLAGTALTGRWDYPPRRRARPRHPRRAT